MPIRIGLGVYDWLTRERRVMPRHVFRGRKATLSQWPQLTERVRFSATYYDAWISYPERLGIELVADAEDIAPDSVALNYATIHRRDGDDLELVDGPTGKALPVIARVIVNATGAWLDDTREELAGPAERMVAGTKGSHLVIHNTALRDALGGHMFYFENADGRVCIVFPYLGQVLAGATDIRVDKATRVRCEDDERDYILDALRRLFPNVPLMWAISSSASAASGPCRAVGSPSPGASPATTSPAASRANSRRYAWSAASGRLSEPSPSRLAMTF